MVDLGLGCGGPRGLDQIRPVEARRSGGPSYWAAPATMLANPNDPRAPTEVELPVC